MNFKPTIWKVISSIIISAILNVLLFTKPGSGYEVNWTFEILGLIVIYIIWSLIQKKK